MRGSRPIVATVAVTILVTLWPSLANGADDVARIRLTATFTSEATALRALPDGHVYGWNHFTATTLWDGWETAVDFLGAVNYVDGSGPFEGFVTLTRADGLTLGLRLDGAALASETPHGSRTHFTARVVVIQGSNEFKGATGVGLANGYRSGELGSPVILSFTIIVKRQ